MIDIPERLKKVRKVEITAEDLIEFEEEVKQIYEAGEIKSPVHLSKGNEEQLIEIFQYVHPEDWVFSSWRNHYHALLHGVDRQKLLDDIVAGNSMGINDKEKRFYASSIVGGIIPIATGAALAIKRKNITDRKVWCFIGDMTFETGVFHESYKYAKNLSLPIQFVVEDNNMSTNTPTDSAWGEKQEIGEDIIYYSYERGFPHHGTGNWILF